MNQKLAHVMEFQERRPYFNWNKALCRRHIKVKHENIGLAKMVQREYTSVRRVCLHLGGTEVLTKRVMATSTFPPKASRGESQEQDKMEGDGKGKGEEGKRRLSWVGIMMRKIGEQVLGRASLSRANLG